ncbi:MAG TPA: hypothetical protein PLU53_02665 [Bacteroidia bacterium]|nr:hypothetical protein [Bacteroidia bacterium]
MNAIEHSKKEPNDTANNLKMLKSVPGYENRTEEELHRISESLKELSLLLRMISLDGVASDHES